RDFLIRRSQKFLLASAERSGPSCSVTNAFSEWYESLIKCDNYLDNHRLLETVDRALLQGQGKR
ncbi:MAG: hypothetical protein P4L69_04795, partial [Desulfosporosinus sp.]|nr:hypothetical protein [Desulfosporosinus sp.]